MYTHRCPTCQYRTVQYRLLELVLPEPYRLLELVLHEPYRLLELVLHESEFLVDLVPKDLTEHRHVIGVRAGEW